ncbi:MAG: 1-deoxy-D-xylulose-5-phosphate reductoisomerase [Clostridia bacterium]|nr:1-deoxy-D-xylulose-5-phosphate reductoisomerase [Clostridia bacterium]
MKKTIAILGATGSVGTQALDVARARGYGVDFISVGSNIKLAEQIARELKPATVAVADVSRARELRLLLADTDIRILAGEEGIVEGILESRAETVVNSILGEAGLIPTLTVIDAKKRLALANKEALVIAGDIVMSRALSAGVEILPVDSEHCAIYQSLKSGRQNEIKSLVLTASGGPFFGKTRDELRLVTLEETLAHPTWKMGKKITVDSATLMNKGFEIIEAAHLFGVSADKIQVVIHRESILHSAVEYIDNSIIGEMSVPDMRMCVQYAVDYPERHATQSEPLSLEKIGRLTFMSPDTEAFPLLALAKRAMSAGGACPAIVNAADEIAVGAFLRGELKFYRISEAVAETFEKMPYARDERTLDGILAMDREARAICGEIIKEKMN